MHPTPRVLLLVLASFAALPASAEIYRWTDAQGRVHFTQNLSQVPESQRAHASQPLEGRDGRPVLNRVRSAELSPPPASPSRVASRSGPIQIPFEPRSGGMIVMVRLNDRVTAPFLVDTGASDVSVPAAVATRAGIVVGPGTQRALYTTANGVVSSPVVTLDAAQVGGARVEGVRASISDAMPIGLLGGSFFNNFTFQVDPASNVITLFPNDRVRSGQSRTTWQRRFGTLRQKVDTLERYIEENHFFRESRRQELDQRLAELREELDQLDADADRAGVPQSWREG